MNELGWDSDVDAANETVDEVTDLDDVDEQVETEGVDIAEELSAIEIPEEFLEVESETTADRRGFLENLEDPDLFENNPQGEYHYAKSDSGKSAWGSLELSDEGVRNPQAQREAGREFREETDDGGHLIGTRFGGSPELENIDAQDRNLNRGAYKREENRWADSLEEGNQVFVSVDTYKSNGSDRPSAYMGYTITEDDEGHRSWDSFSFTNVSSAEQREWEELDKLYDEAEM